MGLETNIPFFLNSAQSQPLNQSPSFLSQMINFSIMNSTSSLDLEVMMQMRLQPGFSQINAQLLGKNVDFCQNWRLLCKCYHNIYIV